MRCPHLVKMTIRKVQRTGASRSADIFKPEILLMRRSEAQIQHSSLTLRDISRHIILKICGVASEDFEIANTGLKDNFDLVVFCSVNSGDED